MEQIWKWKQLDENKKLDFTTFIITSIIENKNHNPIQALILLSVLKFLKSLHLIAVIFYKNLELFEVDLLKKIKHVRLQLQDDFNLEYMCFVYDFLPIEVKCFIDQIRKQHNKIETMEQCIHFIRCDLNNQSHYKWFLENNGTDLEIMIQYLKYDERCFPFYSDQDFIVSFIFSKNLKIPENAFLYDIRYVPKYPNAFFLQQVFDSIDQIVIERKHIPLLLNHLQNLMEDKLLTTGIIAKMLIYKLTNDVSNFSTILQMTKPETNEFINFLIQKALTKPPNLSTLKIWIQSNQLSDLTLLSILHVLKLT